MRVLAGIVAILVWPGFAGALTVSWDCNQEADMKEYRLEYSSSQTGPWGVVGTYPHPVPCTSPIKVQDNRYLAPGTKRWRVFASDQVNQVSEPSMTATFTVQVSPIGNPGGQTEQPLPPSPFNPDVPAPVPLPVPPIPPPVVTPPPPAPTRPGEVTAFTASLVGSSTATVTFLAPAGSKVNVRYMPAPLAWGAAASAQCDTSPCVLTGLIPDTLYEGACIPYFGVMNQGAVYGNFCQSITFRTLAAPIVPPSPTPVPPPVPTSPSVLAALEQAVDACLARKLAHRACFKLLQEELRKVAR